MAFRISSSGYIILILVPGPSSILQLPAPILLSINFVSSILYWTEILNVNVMKWIIFYPEVFIQGFISKDFPYFCVAKLSPPFFLPLSLLFYYLYLGLESLWNSLLIVVSVEIQFYFSPYSEPLSPISPNKPIVNTLSICDATLTVHEVLHIHRTASECIIGICIWLLYSFISMTL